MNFEKIAEQIIDLQNADLALREKLIRSKQLSDGYCEEMKKLHNRNATELDGILKSIGYPTVDKVGKEASEAAWLIIQHAIEQPKFMKKCAVLLQIAVIENNADAKKLAYLADRIAVFEDKPQLYGTQFDWDENGMLSPNKFDNLNKVNKRRNLIGLNSLQDQTEIMRNRMLAENQKPPTYFKQRKVEIEAWKINFGWINRSISDGGLESN